MQRFSGFSGLQWNLKNWDWQQRLPDTYEYELPQEYGICCYRTGRHREAILVNDAIMAWPNIPPHFLETAKRISH